MTEIHITLTQLQSMIGQCVSHQGTPCQVIEVLEQHTELVLIHQEHCGKIQPDQHGDAHRRVHETFTIPVLTADRTELHPSFLALDLL